MHRIARAVASVAVAVLLVACGDDTAAPDEDTLTEAEAAALAEVVLGLTLDAGFGDGPAGSPSATAAAAATEIDLSFEFESACPLGGTMAVALEIQGVSDPDTGAGEATMTLAETPRGCAVRHEGSGRIFTLDGAPRIVTVVDLVTDGSGAATLEGTYEGAVRWETDGRSGTCTLDLAFSGDGDPVTGEGSGTLQGTACGVSVDHAWST